jgi:hypothetical protein
MAPLGGGGLSECRDLGLESSLGLGKDALATSADSPLD